jgi:hypothetical protein
MLLKKNYGTFVYFHIETNFSDIVFLQSKSARAATNVPMVRNACATTVHPTN